jgi:ring-1,2-phenylacetyl-CoA epoxidase subunit PaaE
MPKFHPLKVSDIRRETADCVSVSFDVPAELAGEYTFVPGQYLTFRTEINGEDIRRSYSICSAPSDGELRVAVKKVEGGRFSTFANEDLRVGDVLSTMTPMGRFTVPIEPSEGKTYVGFAAGSGITPLMSIMKTVLREEPKSEFVLFYGNRNTPSIIFKEEIEDLKNRYIDRLSVYHLLSGEELNGGIFSGRIDGIKCKAWSEKVFNSEQVDHFMLCGPGTMIEDVRQELESQGVPREKVHFELFTTPGQAKEQIAKKKAIAEEDKGKKSSVRVIIDGTEFSFPLGYEGDNVLDAALKAGADVPFACKGAVCATCKAKVQKGEMEMDMNYSLEPDELEANYVLTCQAHPRTEEVIVNYDI